MPRQPKLRKKQVGQSAYWFTEAGGDTYFGNIDEVTYKAASKLFADHLLRIRSEESANKKQGRSTGELMDLFLEWVQTRRDRQTYSTRRTYCSRFGAFKVGTGKVKIGFLPADKVRGEDLENWLASLKEEGLGPQTRLHAETSIRHCWNWATKHPSATPYLPSTFRPFSAVERTHVPQKALTEESLLSDGEVKAIFAAAPLDPEQFRRHGLARTIARTRLDHLRRTEGLAGGFADLLRCYYLTGARTDELASCRVEDVLFGTKQVVLGKHKRSRTQKRSSVRQVTLNDEAFAVFRRHCVGKQQMDHVFLNKDGHAWTVRTLAKRFERVKEVASALGLGTVRPEITIYDFRHLWISDSLMANNDITLVARIAGTSIVMIERVYGHFRNQHLHAAQEKLDQLRHQRMR